MHKPLVICFFIAGIICNLSVAASNGHTQSKILTDANEFTIRDDIVNLVELSTNTPNKARNIEQKIATDASSFNYAEQYLILLINAKIKQHEQQHKNVILLIEEAELLRKHIPVTQLNLPLFSNAYLVLANSHAAMKDYENAYQNKKDFIDNYNEYNEAKRENAVNKLTEKYEVAHKREANKLLENQNKLKELRIGDMQKQQESQQNKFLLIICTILLFILFFVRQLKVRKKLLILAQTDSLTGLLNRTALFSKGQHLIQASREQQLEFSLLLFDIDHFKLINDQLGHSVGDEVLKKIAQLVNETMRSRDVFARLGGEEFVAILPNTANDQAKAIAVRVIEKIAEYSFSELGIKNCITLSIGVANIKDTNAEFDDILHAADLAMYQAKALGRNQMVSYESIAKDQERRQL